MTYPQQYAQPQMPGYPQAPEQQFQQAPPQQPQYAPPQQGFAPAPGYPPMQPQYGAPQFPQQGYPQQFAPPAPQLAAGSLDAFYQQPSSGGGAALKFETGTRHVGVVSRPITNADIQQQTNPSNGQPATFKDGRPKFVMKVPLQLQPTQDRPDGLGQWYVAGGARDELVRAMAEAGGPEGPPEAGAILDITCTGTRSSGPGMNPAKVYQVRYTRPNGAQQAAPAQSQQAPVQAQQVYGPTNEQAGYVPGQLSAQVPANPVQQAPMPPAPQMAAAGPSALTGEQQALLAQLTNQPVG